MLDLKGGGDVVRRTIEPQDIDEPNHVGAWRLGDRRR